MLRHAKLGTPLSFLEQASGRQLHKRRSNNWKPGTSGNPLGGALLKMRTEAQRARYEELRQAILAEFTSQKPSILELALIGQCADLLERAERRAKGDDQSVRLSRAGVLLLDKLRAGRKEREPKKRLPTLKELGLE
jgi:hypothetical protein